jgi:uncharacterized protein YdhG (YjbR/CyaY superfamily)
MPAGAPPRTSRMKQVSAARGNYPVHQLHRDARLKISANPVSPGGIDMRDKLTTIDEYIASFAPEVQEKLQAVRAVIRRAAPDAEEAIRYGIPTFRLNGSNLVHFAAFKDHLSFFPTASGVGAFRQELSAYTLSKGTIQFPLDMPVPYDLVERIVRFRVEESLRKNEGWPAQDDVQS